jgi:hypothetical protein
MVSPDLIEQLSDQSAASPGIDVHVDDLAAWSVLRKRKALLNSTDAVLCDTSQGFTCG